MPSVIEMLQMLAVVLACGLLPFAMVGYPCCCTCYCCDVECSVCGPGDGKGPAEFEVVISGFANDQCTGCSGVDGTYVVPYRTGAFFECFWDKDLSATWTSVRYLNGSTLNCSTSGSRRVQVDAWDISAGSDRTQVYMEVTVKLESEEYYYRSSTENQPDCCAYADEAAAYHSQFRPEAGVLFGCSGSAATVTFTSVPA